MHTQRVLFTSNEYSVICHQASMGSILPKELNHYFSLTEKISLFFRSIRGYELFYVYLPDDTLASYCFVKKNYFNKYPFVRKNDGLINPYFTFEQYRGKGFATLLIMTLKGLQKYENIYALVLAENESSLQILQKCGFEKIGYCSCRQWSKVIHKETNDINVMKLSRSSSIE